MNRFILIFIITLSNTLFGQESSIESKIISVTCDENIDVYRFNTRLTKDSIVNGNRIIHFSTTATCCVNFEIESKLTENKVKINLREYGDVCECICAYDFVVQFNSELTPETNFFIKNKELKTDLPKVRPYEKRYFVYENDTTGFDDENGLRQGYMVINRGKDLKKIYWKDGKFIKLEITDLKGNILISETDEDKMFDH